MEIKIKLRNETLGDMLPQWEWRVVDLRPLGSVVFRSSDRRDCADWLTYDATADADYRLERVRKSVRPELSTYARSLCKILVEKHGRANKISILKDIRAVYGLGLKEAKDLIEDYLEDN